MVKSRVLIFRERKGQSGMNSKWDLLCLVPNDSISTRIVRSKQFQPPSYPFKAYSCYLVYTRSIIFCWLLYVGVCERGNIFFCLPQRGFSDQWLRVIITSLSGCRNSTRIKRRAELRRKHVYCTLCSNRYKWSAYCEYSMKNDCYRRWFHFRMKSHPT